MLQSLGLGFVTAPAEIDETPFPAELPADFARRMAFTKARTVAATHPDSWILGADTVVTLAGKILGKPRDRSDALALLHQLSGQTHQVISGICLCAKNNKVEHTEADTTAVTFNAANHSLLEAYVATGEPMDKAGAYGIQGSGSVLVRRIDGSCANVIGLPIDRVIALLLHHGVIGPAGRC